MDNPRPNRPCPSCGSLEFALLKDQMIEVQMGIATRHVATNVFMCTQCGRMEWFAADTKATLERLGAHTELVNVPGGEAYR